MWKSCASPYVLSVFSCYINFLFGLLNRVCHRYVLLRLNSLCMDVFFGLNAIRGCMRNWVLEGSPTLQKLGTVLVKMKTDRRSRSPGSNEHYKERRREKKHKNVNLSSHAAVGLLQIIAVWGDEPVCHLVSLPILLSQDPNVTDINSLVFGRWHGYLKKFYEKRKVWTLFL